MKDLFTIGEMAKLFQMNIRTLRYYDEIGLVHPEETDERTGYRFYSTRQFERLNTIKYLRTLGMPLKKISLFFQNRDVQILEGLLREQQEEIQKQIEVLCQMERKLQYRLQDLKDATETVDEGIQEVCYGKRQIAFLRKEIPLGEDLEYSIRELECGYDLNPVMFLGKVGVSISKENMMNRQFENFSGIFVLLEEEDHYTGAEQYLEEGIYLTRRFTGTHSQAREHYLKLLDYMKEKGYRCQGASVEITLIDSGFTNDVSQYVTEIEIPIKKP